MGNCQAVVSMAEQIEPPSLPRRRRRRFGRGRRSKKKNNNADNVFSSSSSSSSSSDSSYMGTSARRSSSDSSSMGTTARSSQASKVSSSSSAKMLEELRRIRVVDMEAGSVVELREPIPASIVNARNPDSLVCDADSLLMMTTILQMQSPMRKPRCEGGNAQFRRPIPLHSAALLAPGHVYVLLPLPAFRRPLSPSCLDALASIIGVPTAVSDSHSDLPPHQIHQNQNQHNLLLHRGQQHRHRRRRHHRRIFPFPMPNRVWPCNVSQDSCIDAAASLSQASASASASASYSSVSGSSTSASSASSSSSPPSQCIITSPTLLDPSSSSSSSSIHQHDPSTKAHRYLNVCGDSADALSRYIELLIERGNRWTPTLDAIHEPNLTFAAHANE